MNIAVLVSGSHYSGKSRIINTFLKPKLNIGIRQRIFWLNGKRGHIWAQSPEEKDCDLESMIAACHRYRLVVIPCRPPNESPSYLRGIRIRLRQIGFDVHEVSVIRSDEDRYHAGKAKEILDLLNM